MLEVFNCGKSHYISHLFYPYEKFLRGIFVNNF